MSQCSWHTNAGRPCVHYAPNHPNFPVDDPRIVLCGPHKSKATGWFVPEAPPGIPFEESFVYFVLNRQSSQIKIGRSVNPASRIANLQSQAGLKYETLLVLPETAAFTERDAHTEANAYRRNGTEWFEASPAMFRWVEALRRYADDEAALKSASYPPLREVSA